MTDEQRSPRFTVTMAEGTLDMITSWAGLVADSADITEATDLHDLAHKRQVALEEALNLLAVLVHRAMSTTTRDGNICLYPDTSMGAHGLGFSYDCGLTGAILLTPAREGRPNTWSIHT
jgi:hypothetical protein